MESITVPWFAVAGSAALLFGVGLYVGRKLEPKWFAILALLFNAQNLEALAILAWESNLLPEVWKRIRFQNDVKLFVAYINDLIVVYAPKLNQMENLPGASKLAFWRDSTTHRFQS